MFQEPTVAIRPVLSMVAPVGRVSAGGVALVIWVKVVG